MSTTVFIPQPGMHYLAVPPEHVEAVRGFLATLTPDEDVVGVNHGVDDALITDSLLRDIAAGDAKATQIVSEAMDVLSERPEHPMNLLELSERTKRPLSQLRTVWTHLSRYMKQRFDHKKWPVHARSGYRFDPPIGGEEVYYWLSEDVSARWRRIRGLDA